MEISSWEISVMSPPLSWLSYIFGTFIHTNPLNSLFADTGSDLWIFTRWSLSFMWIAVAWVLKMHLWCDGISVRGEGWGFFRTWNVLRGGNLTKNKLEFLGICFAVKYLGTVDDSIALENYHWHFCVFRGAQVLWMSDFLVHCLWSLSRTWVMQISKERLVACSLHRVELKEKGSRVGSQRKVPV